MSIAPGTVNYSSTQVVTVTGSANSIDTSSSSVTTTVDGNLIDPAAANAARASKPRRARAKAGSGGGIGFGQGGNVGGGEYKSAVGAGVSSPEELKRRELTMKLQASLLAVADRLRKKDTKAGADEARFIRDGKAEIQIWLTDKSAENLAKLKELGFEVVLDPKSAKLIIGRLSIEKLEALTELKFVRYVAPQVSGK